MMYRVNNIIIIATIFLLLVGRGIYIAKSCGIVGGRGVAAGEKIKNVDLRGKNDKRGKNKLRKLHKNGLEGLKIAPC